jgi:hypothetical protein
MHHKVSRLLLGFLLLAPNLASAADPTTAETIVMLRHGEKPAAGLGQLNCQGLNRALALPAVIAGAFGRPTTILAPDPAKTKEDSGIVYDYVRPLATIEPTAIAFGLPVDTSIGWDDVKALQAKLESPSLRASTVLVAWEHYQIDQVAQALMAAHGGSAARIPKWKGNDFDSIYVLRITRAGDASTITFEHRTEGLNGRPTTCPG